MPVNIYINTDNAAFEDNPLEISDILKDASDKINAGERDFSLRDYNGAPVGTCKVD